MKLFQNSFFCDGLRLLFLFFFRSQFRYLVLLEFILLLVVWYHTTYELSTKLSKLSLEAPVQSEPKLPQSESNYPQSPKRPSEAQVADEFEYRDRFSLRMQYLRLALLFLSLPSKNVKTLVFVSSMLPEFMLGLYANAKMTLLIEKLCKTQVDTYEEALDSDEFDEDAPPPSVSVSIGPLMTLIRACSLLWGGLPNWLSWQRPLASRLAKCSVIAFLDRAGPIAEPFPLPCEVCGVQGKELVRFPLTVTVSSSDRQLNLTFEDPSAKPDLSLLCFLSSLFDLERTHPRTCHLFETQNDNKMTTPYEQSCLCIFEKLFQNGVNHVKLVQSQRIQDGMHVLEVCVSTFDGVFQVVLLCGDFTRILEKCSHYYDPAQDDILEIDSDLRTDLESYAQYLQQQDSKPFSLAFIPILEEEEDGTFEEMKEFIWISGFALAYTPKEEMAELVQDLAGAGIRFVYFSPLPERGTKAFADRLEMETDWNSCIILSSESANPATSAGLGYSAVADIKARLPHGVGSIRQHLLDVDDIPLHVSFFAECDREGSKEMLRIYRENGEAVVSVFSLSNSSDSQSMYSASGLCIGMGSSDLASLSNSMLAWPCSFLLPYEASPYVLTDILKEARRLTRLKEHFVFFLPLYCAFLGSDSVLLEYIVLAGVCMLLQRKGDAQLLKEMPENLNQPVVSWKNTRDWTLMFCGLLVPKTLCPRMGILPFLLLHYSVVNVKALIVLGLVLPFYISLSMDLKEVLYSIFASIIVYIGSWHFYKRLERRFEKQQKRSKLIFNTKLGMHSPV